VMVPGPWAPKVTDAICTLDPSANMGSGFRSEGAGAWNDGALGGSKVVAFAVAGAVIL